MAIVKLDMTEFQLMKDKEALLEESLKREQAQNDKIAELQAEKLVILEESAMSVTYKTKTIKTEDVYTYYPVPEIIKRIQSYLDDLNRRHSRGNIQRLSVDSIDPSDFYGFLDMFFERRVNTSEGNVSIIRKGLDEVTAEIKAEYTKEQDELTKIKLDKYVKITQEVKVHIDEKRKSEQKIRLLNKEAGKQVEIIEDLTKENKTLNDNLSSQINNKIFIRNKLNRIKELAKSTSTFWSKSFKVFIKKVLNIIEEKQEVEDEK